MVSKSPRKPKKLNPIAKAISDLAAGAIPGSQPKPQRRDMLDPPRKASGKKTPKPKS